MIGLPPCESAAGETATAVPALFPPADEATLASKSASLPSAKPARMRLVSPLGGRASAVGGAGVRKKASGRAEEEDEDGDGGKEEE